MIGIVRRHKSQPSCRMEMPHGCFENKFTHRWGSHVAEKEFCSDPYYLIRTMPAQGSKRFFCTHSFRWFLPEGFFYAIV